jgi:uncharacterized membrane protein
LGAINSEAIMNDAEMLELLTLKAKQRRLEEQVAGLGAELQRLESKFSAPAPKASPPAEPPVTPPKPILVKPSIQPLRLDVTPPKPPVIEAYSSEPTQAPQVERTTAPEPTPIPPPFTPAPGFLAPAETGPAPAPSTGLEVRIGKFWFVRVGVVLLLTGLVFLGHYAYQNWIGLLGPAAKLAMLYTASGILLGTGAWLQRRETTRNYAQVLLAGGMAAVYFTTYAAHYVERLRVIESPALDGILLLGWAGFMVWMADRRKSEVLAMFSIGLAYYTSIITKTGSFTLYSNLVLTAAAVFFLVRNRWAALSFGSLIATYAGYGFWRFHNGEAWHWAMPGEGLWAGASFLAGYWLLFTAAVFLSKHEKLKDVNRATFLSLNNGAFFTLFLLTMWQTHTGGFWRVAIGFGLVLIVCAAAAARLLSAEPHAQNTYLTQGLVLVTVGLIAKFTGLQLGLMLAAESFLLLSLGLRLNNRVMRVGGYLSAPLAVVWSLTGLRESDPATLYLGAATGAFMVANALLADQQMKDCDRLFRIRVTWFTLLAILSWVGVTWVHAERGDLPALFAAQAVLLTFSFYLLRVREVVWISQGVASLGVLAWLGNAVAAYGPWGNHWQPGLLAALLFVLGHWWERPRLLAAPHPGRTFLRVLYGLQIHVVLMSWTQPHFSSDAWITVLCALAAGLTAYGALTRFWSLAGCAQVALISAGVLAVFRILDTHPNQWHMLSPMVAFGLLAWATERWLQARPVAAELHNTINAITQLYRWVVVGLLVAWVIEFIPEHDRVTVFTSLGFAAFVWAGLRRKREVFLQSGVLTGVGLLFFVTLWMSPEAARWSNLFAAGLLLAQQRLARRLPDRFELPTAAHTALICAGCATTLVWLSQWVIQTAGGAFYLTASWSALALALFAAGMVWRERIYRWLGLALIALALGRIVLFDIWKLDTLYRILSFMALGVVLLVLGYIYNRYQEKIREWL